MGLERFLPVVRSWFAERLGEPTEPQLHGWPAIEAGEHTLIAAPTGMGKTLAAFLWALNSLCARREGLAGETTVLYVSPLKALGNDVRKNLQGPLAELRERDPSLPMVRVAVRTGDTPPGERAKMIKTPPHVLVTTPESLYLLLTSAGGRSILKTVETVIVDEIHAVLGDKRGAHLALSLERLDQLAGQVQRIGLSATQKPVEQVAQFLVGEGRTCRVVDVGHRRAMDVAVEVPPSPLAAVCSHEVWDEIYERVAQLIAEHRTTLVFVNTRKLAERVSARLAEQVGDDLVRCHHSSLSKERRLEAEERLKEGSLSALVATASLELGIDIGDVDLVIQIGTTRSIATLLQRVGRAGHTKRATPKGRLFPLTRDELVEAAALMRCVRLGALDQTPQCGRPADILAQQVVAACVAEEWNEQALFDAMRRAHPYRDLTREQFDAVVALHTQGRRALLHRDGVGGRLLATRRARLVAMQGGGAIPDNADYRVVQEPDEAFIGTVDEDFAVEASAGDIFQLGNASWRVLRVERGTMRVADAEGTPPSLPFWFGEAPSRSPELGEALGAVRLGALEDGWLARECGLHEAASGQIEAYVRKGFATLGAVPTHDHVVLERFFDESGGMQLVLHAPLGGRINKAWGFALRKSFCTGFGFELQAAANEDAILISLGPHHSFALEDVLEYVHPDHARDKLVQAVLPTPLFATRWRWNVARSLLLERMQKGQRVPAPLQRMRAEDLMVQAFPQVVACPETLPGGDLPVPWEHPIVRETVEDCVDQTMDAAGMVQVIRAVQDGTITTTCQDTPQPSVFAAGILSAQPYAFLDDAPLEERRTQAVLTRRALDPRSADELGELDPAAVARIRDEAWPHPEGVEEVHEALLWMGYVTSKEAPTWEPWLRTLEAAGRVVCDEGRWFAVEASRDPVDVWRGRLEALGPIFDNDPILSLLEGEGAVLRTRLQGREAWCDRRLLARIHRATLETLRKEIEPVSAAALLRFLAQWQHAAPSHRLEGPRGVMAVVRQLAGVEAPAAAWEAEILPARVERYDPEWLNELTLTGEVAWGGLWSRGHMNARTTPVTLLPRDDLDAWLAWRDEPSVDSLSDPAAAVHAALMRQGAMFPQELTRVVSADDLEDAMHELVAAGLVTGDSFGALRQLIQRVARRQPLVGSGRWSRWTPLSGEAPSVEFLARRLLARTGVVVRKMLKRDRLPVPWRDLLRVFRRLELRGEIRGGRFVGGFDGEQFALPEAVRMLRANRRSTEAPLEVSAADPLNYRGVLTPDARVSALSTSRVAVG